MNKRLFLAINVPSKITNSLSSFIHTDAFKTLLPPTNYHYVQTDKYHITVSFLGNIPQEYIVELCNTINEVIKTFQPFPVLFSRFEFAPIQNPTMVWAQFISDKKFITFYQEIHIAVKHFLAQKDRRIEFRVRDTFTPHVTLIRLNENTQIHELPEFDFKLDPFLASDLILYESQITQAGSYYSKIAVFPLTVLAHPKVYL
jgi:RNA 2',3'-cyclic 3'-phosphodiesterase